MAQVLKEEVRQRITSAALRCFARKGVVATTMSEIAAQAEVAVANLYRYFASKDELYSAVVTDALVERFEQLLTQSAHAHAFIADQRDQRDQRETSAPRELLEFWLHHRLVVVILLEHAEGTPHERFAQRFVDQLVAASIDEIRRRHPEARLLREERLVLAQIFDNTRRMIATILRSARSDREARAAITTFRSYQIAGLAGFVAHICARGESDPGERAPPSANGHGSA
ncbi:MAG: TetR/AcrR family transcriptional regulator [Polyangiales bacterium]